MDVKDSELEARAAQILDAALRKADATDTRSVELHPNFAPQAIGAIQENAKYTAMARKQIMVSRLVCLVLLLVFVVVYVITSSAGLELKLFGFGASVGLFICIVCINYLITPIEQSYGTCRLMIGRLKIGFPKLSFQFKMIETKSD